MMQPGTLLLAYTKRHEAVHEAVAALAAGWEVHAVEIDPADTAAYHAALLDEWKACAAAERPLFNLEHDVVPNAAAFEALAATDRQVVGFPYWEGASHNVGLGCCAFSGEFVAKHADLLEAVGKMTPPISDEGVPLEGPARHWEWLACRIHVQLLKRRVGLPGNLDVVVQHLHEYETPDPGDACDLDRCATHGIRRFKLDRMECD